MPRIDIEGAPRGSGSRYPEPFDEPCRERSWRRLGDAAGLTQSQYLEDKGPDNAKETVHGILSGNLENPPDLLLGIWSYNTPAIVEIVEELKLKDKVTVVGFDAEPKAITYMGEGKVSASGLTT